jgi:hypothetical protein
MNHRAFSVPISYGKAKMFASNEPGIFANFAPATHAVAWRP